MRDGWKPGKTAALEDPNDPFQGGPLDLVTRGITSVTKADGSVVQITPRTRLRFGDLSDESLEQIGILHLKGRANPRSDVVHQEYVETWTENVANDPKHRLNNLVATTATVEAFFGYFAENEEIADAAELIQRVLHGEGAEVFSFAARISWIGRAIQDGSWDVSSDAVHRAMLGSTIAALDPYVVVPVLSAMKTDFESGYIASLIPDEAVAA